MTWSIKMYRQWLFSRKSVCVETVEYGPIKRQIKCAPSTRPALISTVLWMHRRAACGNYALINYKFSSITAAWSTMLQYRILAIFTRSMLLAVSGGYCVVVFFFSSINCSFTLDNFTDRSVFRAGN